MGPDEPPVTMTLTVEFDLPAKKPYHGGYRHKVSGVVYHHAGSQTEAPPKPQRAPELLAAPRFHRETQTRLVREKAVQVALSFLGFFLYSFLHSFHPSIPPARRSASLSAFPNARRLSHPPISSRFPSSPLPALSVILAPLHHSYPIWQYGWRGVVLMASNLQ